MAQVQTRTDHALTPLTVEELAEAVAILRAERGVDERYRFVQVALNAKTDSAAMAAAIAGLGSATTAAGIAGSSPAVATSTRAGAAAFGSAGDATADRAGAGAEVSATAGAACKRLSIRRLSANVAMAGTKS